MPRPASCPAATGRRSRRSRPTRRSRPSDGELLIAAGNDRAFASLCTVLDVPALVTDPRYATNAARVANRDSLVALLEPLIAAGTREGWLERFAAANVPAAPIQDVREVIEHPQTVALGLLQQLGGLPVAGLPVSVDGERVHMARRLRRSAAILRRCCAKPATPRKTIRELAADGVIRVAG